MWKIKQIAEVDFGCEERTSGEKLKALVILENENRESKNVEVLDEWLVENNLDEGSDWPEETDDWTKKCDTKNVDTAAFTKKMTDLKNGKEVDWKCPFCDGEVALLSNEKGHTTIGCKSCDMRINLEAN